MSGFQRRKHPLDDWLAARREQQPTVVRCTLDGCQWQAAGAFAETRQAAAEHRARAHPDHRPRSRKQLLAELGRPTTVGKMTVPRRDPRITLSEQHLAEARRLLADGWTVWKIARIHHADWGYASTKTLDSRLRTSLAIPTRQEAA